MSNRNVVYSEIFVDELARAGLISVCIAPGSRSTPLTMAFAKHDGIKVYSHLDERSMAFFALGLALASDAPVAILCTSGSAAANFFPAIVEAHQSRVPLIVLTSDRPHELRHSGANQTIDQIKMFGDYALWFVDAALPEANPPAVAIRNLRTLAARAFAKANGIRKGVVHINLPFRKPLEPTPVESDFKVAPAGAEAREWHYTPYTQLVSGKVALSDEQLRPLKEILALEPLERGLIVCGRGCPPDFFPLVELLSRKSGYPVIAESISGVRFYPSDSFQILNGYDSYLGHLHEKPEIILRFGDVPTSEALNAYLEKSAAKCVFQVSASGDWADDTHRITDFIQTDEVQFCASLIKSFGLREDASTEWRNKFSALESLTWQTIDEGIASGKYFDGAVVYDVVDLIPPESTLFAGNSLAIRHLDQFGKPSNKRIFAYANRGASGIDGNISTALGTGAARPDKPLVAIVGDITFYHDMNGLLAVHRCGVPVTIVLLNNNGGGIFHRLPIKDFDPEFTNLWITPHDLDFSHAAKLYGLDYIQVTEREAFRQAFSASVNNRTSTIIEVRTDAKVDLARRAEIMQAVQAKLQAL